MEKEDFRKQIKESLEKNKLLAMKQESKPSEENCKAMVDSFNQMIQSVMDEVGCREDWREKIKVVCDFEEILTDFCGLSQLTADRTLRVLLERMLLDQWGVDNPHDPFHE